MESMNYQVLPIFAFSELSINNSRYTITSDPHDDVDDDEDVKYLTNAAAQSFGLANKQEIKVITFSDNISQINSR